MINLIIDFANIIRICAICNLTENSELIICNDYSNIKSYSNIKLFTLILYISLITNFNNIIIKTYKQ